MRWQNLLPFPDDQIYFSFLYENKKRGHSYSSIIASSRDWRRSIFRGETSHAYYCCRKERTSRGILSLFSWEEGLQSIFTQFEITYPTTDLLGDNRGNDIYFRNPETIAINSLYCKSLSLSSQANDDWQAVDYFLVILFSVQLQSLVAESRYLAMPPSSTREDVTLQELN